MMTTLLRTTACVFWNNSDPQPMKTHYQLFSRSVLLAGFILASCLAQSRGDDVFVSQFNDAGSLSRWRFDYGGVTNLIEFDATQDRSNNAASGSMKVTFGFN